MARYLTEFIGTFFLVLTIGLTVLSGNMLAPLAIGLSLMGMVYMGGHISGAHYNPAISLALLLRRKFSARDCLPYILAQVLGAVGAAWVVYVVMGQTFAPAVGSAVSPATALLAELLYTLALGLVVLNSAVAKGTEGNSFYGLAIGLTVTVGIFAAGPVSGGVFNPAVGLGPILVKALVSGGGFGDLWIYLVGPVAGGAVAASVFGIQNPSG